MTNPPRYPADQSEYRPEASPYVGQPYPNPPTHVPPHLRYDWRLMYNPYQPADQPITAPIPRVEPKKSRRGIVVAGAVAVAMVGSGIGAATMLANERPNEAPTIKAPPVAQAPATPHPAAKQPAGSVEQVAA